MVKKGQIARFEKFLLLSPCFVFKKTSAAEVSENSIWGKGLIKKVVKRMKNRANKMWYK